MDQRDADALRQRFGQWAYCIAQGRRTALVKTYKQSGAAIDADRCALVVVHIEEMTVEPGYLMDVVGMYDPSLPAQRTRRLESTVWPNLEKLIGFFRGRQRPIVFTHVGKAGIHPRLGPLRATGEWAILTIGDVFLDSQLEAILKENAIETVFLCGVETSHCVAFSTFGAMSRGYQAIVVEDATADPRPDHFEAILKVLGLHALVKTTDEVVGDYPWENWIAPQGAPAAPSGV